jgi:hypothetical protein
MNSRDREAVELVEMLIEVSEYTPGEVANVLDEFDRQYPAPASIVDLDLYAGALYDRKWQTVVSH